MVSILCFTKIVHLVVSVVSEIFWAYIQLVTSVYRITFPYSSATLIFLINIYHCTEIKLTIINVEICIIKKVVNPFHLNPKKWSLKFRQLQSNSIFIIQHHERNECHRTIQILDTKKRHTYKVQFLSISLKSIGQSAQINDERYMSRKMLLLFIYLGAQLLSYNVKSFFLFD